MRRIDLPAPEQWQDEREQDEARQVNRWRYHAARDAGLSKAEAEEFADGDGDIALLRSAQAHHASHDQLVEMFL